MASVRFEFDWDPAKAAANLAKHGVSFDEAMTVFLDPFALSRPDDDPIADEDRWVTIGESRPRKLLLVVHTHVEVDQERVAIRIISPAGRPDGRHGNTQRAWNDERRV